MMNKVSDLLTIMSFVLLVLTKATEIINKYPSPSIGVHLLGKETFYEKK